MNASKIESERDHLPWLDGLRGFAAAWVLISHVQVFTGLPPIFILSWGQLAVDLFMMLSGFLMTHHYLLRERSEPWSSPTTWQKFWLRRYFRIAPVYYFLLALVLLFGSWYADWRQVVSNIWPAVATPRDRYIDVSIFNILAHSSFAFGAIPSLSFKTVLPDWSIGLEMQFYLVFPFLILFMRRAGYFVGGAIVVFVCLVLRWVFADFFRSFPQPSILPLKIEMFVVGIWLAVGRSKKILRIAMFAALALMCFVALRQRTHEAAVRVVMTLLLYYLLDVDSLPLNERIRPMVSWIKRVLSGAISQFLGKTSYSTYLIHLMFLIPI